MKSRKKKSKTPLSDNEKMMDDRNILSSDFARLVNNTFLSDVVFVLEEGTQKVNGHKVILAARSEMFRALLFGGMKESSQTEIVIEEVKHEIFLLLMEYLYSGTITLTENTVVELFVVANKYGIDPLVKKCGNFLSESLSGEKDVCVLLEMAHQYHEHNLFDKCFTFIEQHTAAVLSDPSFLTLPLELVVMIFESDELQVEEIDIYNAAIRWGEAQCKGEEQRLPEVIQKLLPCIRFPCIETEHLLDIVKPKNLVPMELLFDAIAYHASPSHFQGRNEKIYSPRQFRKLRWEVESKSRELQINELAVTVCRPGSIGCFPVVRSDEVFSNGLVELRIENLPEKGNITSVGIATLPAFFQLRDGVLGNRVVGRVKNSFGYVKLAQPPGDSYIFAEGVQIANPVESYTTGDVIGVRLDSAKRSVTFFKNGQHLYPSHPIPPGEYHVVVSLSNDAKITLI